MQFNATNEWSFHFGAEWGWAVKLPQPFECGHTYSLKSVSFSGCCIFFGACLSDFVCLAPIKWCHLSTIHIWLNLLSHFGFSNLFAEHGQSKTVCIFCIVRWRSFWRFQCGIPDIEFSSYSKCKPIAGLLRAVHICEMAICNAIFILMIHKSAFMRIEQTFGAALCYVTMCLFETIKGQLINRCFSAENWSQIKSRCTPWYATW